MAELVTDTNFVRAETDRMFAGLQADAGGVNTLLHHRAPAPLDHQTVIRMNRDTLYSLAIIDISAGATLSVPDSGGRYLSVMIVNEDHYINRVLHEAGEYELTIREFDTPYVLVAVRILGGSAAVAGIQTRPSRTCSAVGSEPAASCVRAPDSVTRDTAPASRLATHTAPPPTPMRAGSGPAGTARWTPRSASSSS